MTAEHLGGHCGVTHVDRGALAWLCTQVRIKTMVDVGCGPGGMFKVANSVGIDWTGIDGDERLSDLLGPERWRFVLHDFYDGVLMSRGARPLNTWDLGWAVEFVEHVAKPYIPNYMPVFQACRYVLITHSETPMRLHPMIDDESGWKARFSEYGLELDEDLTRGARSASTMMREFMRTTGQVYRNTSEASHARSGTIED